MSHTIQRCQIVRETDKAICINLGSGEAMWFPLSQVDKIVRGKPGSQWCDGLVVSDWIAKEKGLYEAPEQPEDDEFPPVDERLK